MLDGVANSTATDCRRGGREEPSVTDGLLGVGDAAPHVDAAFGGASQAPMGGVRNGREFGNVGHA